MTVYIEVIWLLNFYIDFLLLITTSLVLKRNTKIKRIVISSLLGSITTIFIFFKISNLILIIFKLIMAIMMCILAFSYKNVKYTITNFIYFYMLGVILGGFIYYLNIEFQYTTLGIFLSTHHWNINYILLLFSPIILLIYKNSLHKLKCKNTFIYNVTIWINNQEYKLKGYLDTGNKLMDPVTNKPIILLDKSVIDLKGITYFYVPFNSIGNHNLLKCFKPTSIKIENKIYKNYLLAISDKKFNLDGVECILNSRLMEEL